MMKLVMALFDKKAEAYMTPFVVRGQGEAVRSLTEVVNKPGTVIYDHPADFDLYQLALFNDASGEFEDGKHFVIGAVSVMEPRMDPMQLDLIGKESEDGDAENQQVDEAS